MKSLYAHSIRVFVTILVIATISTFAIFLSFKNTNITSGTPSETPKPTPTLSLERSIVKENNGWNTLVPDAGYFQISYPDNFEVDWSRGFSKVMPEKESISFQLVNKNTDLRIGINIEKRLFSNLEDYLDDTNFDLLDGEQYNVGNMPGYKVRTKNDFDQESLIYIINNFEKNTYTLTIGVSANSEKISDEDIEIAEQIISTFKM